MFAAGLTHAHLQEANLLGAHLLYTHGGDEWLGAICPDGTKITDASDTCYAHRLRELAEHPVKVRR